MTEVDAFLANCRLADGRLVDIGISGGKIAVVGEGAASLSNSAPMLDIGGDLALPGLVDGHMHLDKTLTGLPWMGHAAGPTRMSRIETDKTILPHLPLPTEERAGNLIRECVARGTTHLRTHVDIDLASGLAKLEGVLAARERYRDRATYNESQWPQHPPWRPLAIFVRDDAQIVAGLAGETYCGWLFVKYLWVSSGLRGRGVGRELMGRAEVRARERGRHSAWLDTFSFQAPGFYGKLGYEEFGRLDYPPDHYRHFMKKRLIPSE